MKKLFIAFIFLVALSCSKENLSKKDQVIKFYSGFNTSDYKKIKNTLADSITITEGDYIMPFSRESYYQQFQWDSVFEPVYDVISVEKESYTVLATIAVESSRFQYLKNNPLKSSHRFYFEDGKISKIENEAFIDTNWKAWENQKNALVNWVKINKPELDGFINDLSKQGAINYLKAIDLYKNRLLN